MKQVYFTKSKKNTVDFIQDLLDNQKFSEVHCIYSEKSPLISEKLFDLDMECVEFKDYGSHDLIRKDHSKMGLIVLGLSQMINPSNRCDERFEYMYNYCKYKTKFVIDNVPYRIEKWRVWYPYGVINPAILGYPHSYAIETAYNNHIKYNREDPIPINKIVEQVKDITTIDYKKYFTFKMKFNVMETTEEQKKEYDELKEQLFEEYTNINSILSRLKKFAKKLNPKYNLIHPNNIYKIEEDIEFHITDLKVDEYFRNKLEQIYSETNQLTEALYRACVSK